MSLVERARAAGDAEYWRVEVRFSNQYTTFVYAPESGGLWEVLLVPFGGLSKDMQNIVSIFARSMGIKIGLLVFGGKECFALYYLSCPKHFHDTLAYALTKPNTTLARQKREARLKKRT